MATRAMSTGLAQALLGTASLADTFDDCVIHCYGGTMPASPDDAAGSTKLGSITQDGGTFTPGAATNALSFDPATLSGKVIYKTVAENWQYKGAAAGTITWGRIVGNAADDELASTTLPRWDFSIGVNSGDIRFSTVTSVVDQKITIDSFGLSLGAS